MLKNINRLSLALMTTSFLGCASSNSKPLSIAFSKDSSAVVISDIDRPGLLRLRQLKPQDSIFKELIAVLQTPSENDSTIREELIPGDYAVSDTAITFTPDQPFAKGREYLVISHINTKFGDAKQIAKGQLSLGVKPTQKSLIR
ncbi:hypothetical protein [Pedobacter sp. JCM 36344]|uniref:hypothetical protein n=1 Tax=Pedobacter sp. JCM 36344 TaxID=3374280 RepID=UPI00397E2389